MNRENITTNTEERILVVDDNQDAGGILALLLRQVGYVVDVAHSGADGLDAARRLRPSVMLIDLHMPGMDGYEVAQQLRASPETRDTRLVAVSGDTSAETQRRVRQSGFDDYVARPFDLATLRAVLNRKQP